VTSVPITVDHINIIVQRMPRLTNFRVAVSPQDFRQLGVQAWMDKLAVLPCRKLRIEWSLPDVLRFPPTLTSLALFSPVNFAMLSEASRYSNITSLKLTVKGLDPICLGNVPTLKRLELVMIDDVPIDWRNCPRVEYLKIVNLCTGTIAPFAGFEQAGCRDSVRRIVLVWQTDVKALLPLVGCPKLESVDCQHRAFFMDDLESLSLIPGICGFSLRTVDDVPDHLDQYLARIAPQKELQLIYGGKSQWHTLKKIFASRMCSSLCDLTVIIGTAGGFFEHEHTRAAFDQHIAGHLHTLNIRYIPDYSSPGPFVPVDSLIPVMRKCTNLKRLTIGPPMDMDRLTAALPDIVGRIEHLKVAEIIRHTYPVTMETSLEWFSRWKSLKSLWIDDQTRPDDTVASAVVKHCPLFHKLTSNSARRPANLPLHIKYICQ
jgi:hypothetical protein